MANKTKHSSTNVSFEALRSFQESTQNQTLPHETFPDKNSEADEIIHNFELQKLEIYKSLSEKDNELNRLNLLYSEAQMHLRIINTSIYFKVIKRISSLFRKLMPSTNSLKKNVTDAGQCASASIDQFLLLPLPFASSKSNSKASLVVNFHIFYPSEIQIYKKYLNNITIPYDLHISTDSNDKYNVILKHFEFFDKSRLLIRVLPNRGRDIAPMLVGFRDVILNYDLLLHLHTKKSPYGGEFFAWKSLILHDLLCNNLVVNSILDIFDTCPSVGLIAPRNYRPIREAMQRGPSWPHAQNFLSMMNVQDLKNDTLDFPAGSMFWARTAALKPLLDLKLNFNDFDEELGQKDGTPAHAIERLFFYSAEISGYSGIHVGSDDFRQPYEEIFLVKSRDSLEYTVNLLRSRLLY